MCKTMKKFKSLNKYQESVLIFMIAMVLIFAVIYPKTISKVGFRYNDTILVLTQETENIIYSGKIQGKQAQFIVSNNNTIVFNYGDKTYGQYTMKEDPTAIPKDRELSERMIGIEIHNDDKILFRGGILDLGDNTYFYNEDGTLHRFGVSFVTSDGIERDENGNPIDRMEPSASTIYELFNEPELTHKGETLAWFGAVFICILNALTILFADELFRWNLTFQIRNVANAEPSDWQIVGRYIGWTSMTIVALVLFIMGLQ